MDSVELSTTVMVRIWTEDEYRLYKCGESGDALLIWFAPVVPVLGDRLNIGGQEWRIGSIRRIIAYSSEHDLIVDVVVFLREFDEI